jgi:hypothetical protein
MKQLKQTPLNDNQIIWLLRITLSDGSIIRIAYPAVSITLSGNVYQGGILTSDGISFEYSKSIDAVKGGIGSKNAISFSLMRSAYYLDKFYPSTSKPYLTGSKVEFGYIYEGETSEDNIDWINTYYVEKCPADNRTIKLFCPEEIEFNNIDLPFYTVQKEYNNGISYCENIESSEYGQIIPIVYGSFNIMHPQLSNVYLAPTVNFDKTKLSFKVASHECKTISYLNISPDATDRNVLFKSSGNGSAYIYLYASNAASSINVNNNTGHLITLLNTSDNLFGFSKIQFKILGNNSSVSNIKNAVDSDIDTYVELDAGEKICLKLPSGLSNTEIGILNRYVNDDIRTIPVLSANAEASRSFDIYFHNNIDAGYDSGKRSTTDTMNLSDNPTAYESIIGFATATSGKNDTNLPYTIEELSSYDFVIENKEVTPGNKINVHYFYLRLENILVLGAYTVTKTYTMRYT